MESRELGVGGPPVPVVGQGTWKMERDNGAQAVASIQRGIALGLTHVDTAEMYGMGEVEELLRGGLLPSIRPFKDAHQNTASGWNSF